MSTLIELISAQPLQCGVGCKPLLVTELSTMRSSQPLVVIAVVLIHVMAFMLLRLSPITTRADSPPIAVVLVSEKQQVETPQLPAMPAQPAVTLPDLPVPTVHTVELQVETVSHASQALTHSLSTAADASDSNSQVATPAASKSELSLLCPERSAPVYPVQAKRLREQGDVLLRVLLDEAGVVRDVEVISSSGSPRLDAASIATVRSWRCQPARRDGHAISTVATQPFEFKLQRH